MSDDRDTAGTNVITLPTNSDTTPDAPTWDAEAKLQNLWRLFVDALIEGLQDTQPKASFLSVVRAFLNDNRSALEDEPAEVKASSSLAEMAAQVVALRDDGHLPFPPRPIQFKPPVED